MPIQEEEIINSTSKISVDLKNVDAVFTLIDKLADNEEDLLIEMMGTIWLNWKELASENILNKLEGYTDKERVALKIVIVREILDSRIREILLRLYNKR